MRKAWPSFLAAEHGRSASRELTPPLPHRYDTLGFPVDLTTLMAEVR
jgi:hypothetical protein